MPVIRGSLGKQNCEWRAAGSGRKIQQVKNWREAQDFPTDWEEQLGEAFVWYVGGNSFHFYLCPQDDCNHLI